MALFETTVNGFRIRASFDDRDINDVFTFLLDKLVSLYQKKKKRVVCFIAAVPGAGKTTLSSFLEKLFKERYSELHLQSIGMDGFHFRQEYLLAHDVLIDGKKTPMIDIKGHPLTFDLNHLLDKVSSLYKEGKVKWPSYNRALHNPIEDDIEVNADIVILEGNYLLLSLSKWDELSSYCDYSVYLDAEDEIIKDRLVERKMMSGASKEKALCFVEKSDLKNAELVRKYSKKPNMAIAIDKQGRFHAMAFD